MPSTPSPAPSSSATARRASNCSSPPPPPRSTRPSGRTATRIRSSTSRSRRPATPSTPAPPASSTPRDGSSSSSDATEAPLGPTADGDRRFDRTQGDRHEGTQLVALAEEQARRPGGPQARGDIRDQQEGPTFQGPPGLTSGTPAHERPATGLRKAVGETCALPRPTGVDRWGVVPSGCLRVCGRAHTPDSRRAGKGVGRLPDAFVARPAADGGPPSRRLRGISRRAHPPGRARSPTSSPSGTLGQTTDAPLRVPGNPGRNTYEPVRKASHVTRADGPPELLRRPRTVVPGDALQARRADDLHRRQRRGPGTGRLHRDGGRHLAGDPARGVPHLVEG